MITPATVLGWLAIGAAASLAAMIWPSRHGAPGVVGNLLLGMLGALLGSLAGVAAFQVRPGGHECLAFTAGGALAALGLGHLAWMTWGRRRHHA